MSLAVLSITENLDPVLDNLDIRGVLRIGDLCQDKRQYIRTYILKRVKFSLKPWLVKGHEFLNVLRASLGVIGGGVALDVILAATWHPENLDLFMRFNDTYRIVHFLVNNEGYRVDQ